MQIYKVLSIAICLLLGACQTEGIERKSTITTDAEGTHTSKKDEVSSPILRYDAVHHPVIAKHGMVSSQNRLASEIGQTILAKGGNAVDSAVAVGFALAVTLPRAGNIGGSGFMLIHMSDREHTIALDFRSTAPALASLDDFRNKKGEIDWQSMAFGNRAPGVPGSVAGLYRAWEMYGSMPWKELLAPAIKLAQEGIVVTHDLAFALSEAQPIMSEYPSSVKTYFKENGNVPLVGETLLQPDLAWSLSEIAKHGSDAFYKGAIAQKIDDYMRSVDGYISKQDLAGYRVEQREPISTTFNNHKVVTMPPVSGGGIAMLQMLNVLNEFPMDEYTAGSAESLHIIAETMKRAAANRRINIGDPDFVDVPTEAMISRKVAKQIAGQIDLNKATAVIDLAPMGVIPFESPETTHYSIADRYGNAVSTTYTLGYSFGAGVVVPGTGILLNNHLRVFSHRVADHANSMQAGKRMLSSMTPTIVFNPQDEVFLITGSPGGSRIPNIVTQVVINAVQYGMNIAEATHAPRIHQQWRTPNLGVEKGISVDTIKLLKQRGHSVEEQPTMGSTQSIMLLDGYMYGSSDPRRPGAATLGVDINEN